MSEMPSRFRQEANSNICADVNKRQQKVHLRWEIVVDDALSQRQYGPDTFKVTMNPIVSPQFD